MYYETVKAYTVSKKIPYTMIPLHTHPQVLEVFEKFFVLVLFFFIRVFI